MYADLSGVKEDRVPNLVPQQVAPLAPSPAVFPVSMGKEVCVCYGSDRSQLVVQDLVSRSPPGKQVPLIEKALCSTQAEAS